MPYDIIFDEDSNVPLQDEIKSIISKVLDYLDYRTRDICVSVSFTTPEEIRQLNSNYRNVDKPTNVLSFPNTGNVLGDIVLCLDIVKKEATEQQKTYEDHLTHLIVHSILHLLGYDHVSDEEAEEMEQKEIDILKTVFKIENPYI